MCRMETKESSLGRLGNMSGRWRCTAGTWDCTAARWESTAGKWGSTWGRRESTAARLESTSERRGSSLGKWDCSWGWWDCSWARWDCSCSSSCFVLAATAQDTVLEHWKEADFSLMRNFSPLPTECLRLKRSRGLFQFYFLSNPHAQIRTPD